MKKIITLIIIATLFSTSSVWAEDTPTISSSGWQITAIDPDTQHKKEWAWTLWPSEPLYQHPIADPFTPTTQFFYQYIVENELTTDNRFEIRMGYSRSLFRFHKENNPDKGVELFASVTIPILLTSSVFKMVAFDGVFALGVAAKPTDWLSFKIFRHHFSSHAGDEIAELDTSTIDWDTSMSTQNALYIRDEFGFALAVEPLKFIEKSPEGLTSRAYGEVYYAPNGKDLFGTMYLVPAIDSPWWFQWGAEATYSFQNPKYGGFYGALNVSHFQENGFSPNTSFMVGYQFPEAKNIESSIGFSWYRGRPRANNFYYMRETLCGLVLKLNF